MPPKIDLIKELRTEYASPKSPAFIVTTPGQYFQIEGKGKPGCEAFIEAVGALYAVAYTTKMRHKKETSVDYTVAKLEAIWPKIPATRDSDDWQWKLMIRVPNFITEQQRQKSIDALIAKKKPESVRDVQLIEFDEGECVQMLHIGPYEDEPETCDIMAAYAAENGRKISGFHHEIYLSDPRRVEPARLKTILRRPTIPAA